MLLNRKKFTFKKDLKFSGRKIYDCFMFFNEIELLNLRLEYLSPHVDFFVLVESRSSTQAKEKPLFFNENKSKFKKFLHKIKYIVINEFPVGAAPHTIETIQRNAMISCLSDCNDDDLVMISDLDEIPILSNAPKKIYDGIVYHFLQDQHIYFANIYKEKHIIWEGGTKLVTYKTINKNLLDELFVKYGPTFLSQYNTGSTLTKIRLYRNTRYIYNGGYHLTYQGGVDKIMQKLMSFSHPELINSGKFNKKFITKNLENGIDIFDTNQKIFSLPESKSSKLLKKLLPEIYFNENCVVQNRFVYLYRRNFELMKIFFRAKLRIMYLIIKNFIIKR